MALHREVQIIKQLKDVTLFGLATTGLNVYLGSNTYDEDLLPCIEINMGESVPLNETGNAKVNAFADKVFEVFITARTMNTSEADLTLKQIEAEVTQAIMSTYGHIGLSFIISGFHAGSGAPTVSMETEYEVAIMEMVWKFHYRHSVTDPTQ